MSVAQPEQRHHLDDGNHQLFSNIKTNFYQFLDSFCEADFAPVVSQAFDDNMQPSSMHDINSMHDFSSNRAVVSQSVQDVGQEGSTFARQSIPTYRLQASQIGHISSTLYIDFHHLTQGMREYVDIIVTHFSLIEPYLNEAVQQLIETIILPDALPKNRHYRASFFNFSSTTNLRELKPENIGHLSCIRVMATKSTRTSPQVIVATFRCADCGAIIPNIKQEFKLTSPTHCSSENCTNKFAFDLLPQESTFSDWQQLTVQESADNLPPGSVPRTIKVILRDSLIEQAKPGDHCRITGCLIAVPDVASLFSSTEQRDSRRRVRDDPNSVENPSVGGLKELGVRELGYKLIFLASNITQMTAAGDFMAPAAVMPFIRNSQRDGSGSGQIGSGPGAGNGAFSPDDIKFLTQLSNDPNLTDLLVRSIAPNIYGHADVKKGILFMLLGGVHKTTNDRTSLRGDLNVLLIGDPSTAKSQFLKFVVDFLPRAVYTSGKASTAAGLTASVARDPDTGEFVIEAGALMLADNGVCCIDEFDKMDEKDQSAIHEAMEQQTISITKAGIQATLNARTSILAAASPISGRYDLSRTVKQNVIISPPIMSRFDLFFILLDQPSHANDSQIAKHMIATHLDKVRASRMRVAGPADPRVQTRYAYLENSHSRQNRILSPALLRTFIRYAQQVQPRLTPEAQDAIVQMYTNFREQDRVNANQQHSYRITVRQLESLVRLSEACARMYLSNTIETRHVQEAGDLLRRSIIVVAPSTVSIPLGYEVNDDDDDDDDDNDDGDNDDDNNNDGQNLKKKRHQKPDINSSDDENGTVDGDDQDDDQEEQPKQKAIKAKARQSKKHQPEERSHLVDDEDDSPDSKQPNALKRQRRPAATAATDDSKNINTAAQPSTSTSLVPAEESALVAAAANPEQGAAKSKSSSSKQKVAVSIEQDLYLRVAEQLVVHIIDMELSHDLIPSLSKPDEKQESDETQPKKPYRETAEQLIDWMIAANLLADAIGPQEEELFKQFTEKEIDSSDGGAANSEQQTREQYQIPAFIINPDLNNLRWVPSAAFRSNHPHFEYKIYDPNEISELTTLWNQKPVAIQDKMKKAAKKLADKILKQRRKFYKTAFTRLSLVDDFVSIDPVDATVSIGTNVDENGQIRPPANIRGSRRA